jgi:pilin isopeptide linkage protein
VSFIIPFEYKNEHSKVEVEKTGAFNPVTQSLDYTITVTAPDTNLLTSDNVKLTDVFQDTSYLVAISGNATGVYADVKAILYASAADAESQTNGTDISSKFALTKSKGVLTIGDMQPGNVVVLTYSAKVSDKYFKNTVYPTIFNSAQATYNDTTSNMVSTEQGCGGSAKIEKSSGNIVTEDGEPYILYTLKVTAYGVVSNLTVDDYFTRSWDAISRLDAFDGQVDYQCDLENNPTHKFTWTINRTLTDKEAVTLTYKAYLNPSAWRPDSNSASGGKALEKQLNIINQADLKLGADSNGENGAIIGTAKVEKKITKQWVYKNGNKNKDTGVLTYTLYVNSDPVAKDITSIYDNLSSESTAAGAKIEYPIKVTVYDSSASSKKQVTSFELSGSSTPGFTSSDTGWRLNLETYDSGSLNNKGYYYVITYTVNSGSANNVINGAGINRGDIGYGVSTTVEAKTITSNKTKTAVNYLDGYLSWQVTMSTDIDAGAVYRDYIDDDKVKASYWWFTMENIEGVEIYQKLDGQEVLIYGKDENGELVNPYNISVDKYDFVGRESVGDKTQPRNITHWTYTTSTDGKYVWSGAQSYGSIGYDGFKVTFNQPIKVEGVGDIIIKYDNSVSWDNVYHFAMTNYRANGTENGSINDYNIDTDNHGQWRLSSGVSKDFGYYSGQPDIRFTLNGVADVVKTSNYDQTTGIITWTIYINHEGDMMGDATVEDYLPKGLEYIEGSAKLSYGISQGNDSSKTGYVDDKFYTGNTNSKYGNIKQVNGKDAVTTEEQDDGTTKLTILLENLHGFSLNQYELEADGSYRLDSNGMPIYVKTTNPNKTDWIKDGNVVLTIQTRISDQNMVNSTTSSYTNKVTVTNATMACGSSTAYATQNVTTNTLDNTLSKNMEGYKGGTTLTFTIDINSRGEDLIYTPEADRGTSKDTLEILDVMSDKMSLATHQSNYFVVKEYDDEGKELRTLTPAASAEIGANEYYVTKAEGADAQEGKTVYKIIVPDGKILKITYKVIVDAAVGEEPDVTNKAYFNYEGLRGDSYTAGKKQSVAITRAKAESGASAKELYFQIYKQDQWGNPIKGVTFQLYKVELNSDGTAGTETAVGTAKATGANGYVTFEDLDDLENENAIYCFREISVPTGYQMSSAPTYFYFVAKDALKLEGAVSATGIGYSDKVFDVTNNFSSASLSVPLKKTINGETLGSSSQFVFTLKPTETQNGASVYTDQACTSANAVTDAGVTATIAGSGTINVDTVYFNNIGTYKFTLAENALSDAQTKEGFKKDDTVYNITVEVENDTSKGLVVTSATYESTDGTKSGDLLKNGIPAFNNTLTKDPVNVTLTATKKLIGDEHDTTKRMKAGEFTFKVVEDEKEVATGEIEADADGDNLSKINFTSITYGQNELGTHYLTIYEVEGDDPTIDYTDVVFFATVTVDTVEGSAQLKADVTYSTQFAKNLDENKQPVFTNKYTYAATGTLSLTATKELRQGTVSGSLSPIHDDEFEFQVYEGEKIVATGKNKADGSIPFSAITYNVSDIGEHEYTIKEVEGNEEYVTYTDTSYQVTVKVTNAGAGVLDAQVTKIDGVAVSGANSEEKAANVKKALTFVNIDTFVIPSTGIRLDILPYLLIVVLAAGFGLLMLMRRRKRI